GVPARTRGDLQHGLHELALDLALRGPRVPLEHRLDRVDELIRLAIDDHELFLDADRVARPGEVMLHPAGQPSVRGRAGRKGARVYDPGPAVLNSTEDR